MPARAVKPAPSWRNRIVRHADIDPRTLTEHPNQWREHPPAQQEALAGVIHDVGYIQPVLVSEATGFILDGHLRVGLAIREEQATIPVTYVQVDAAEERLILSTIDPLAALAESNREQLAGLLANVSSGDPAVQQLLADVAQRAGVVPGEGAGSGEAGADVTEPDEPWDRLAEVLERWQVKEGDLWALGDHRIICADCLDPATLERLLDGHTPQMIFADPPYGVSIVATNVSVGGGGQRQKDLTGHYPIEAWGQDASPRGAIGGKNPLGSKNNLRIAPHLDTGKYAPVIGDDSPVTAIRASTHFLTAYPDAVHVWWGGNYYADHLPASSCWLVWNKETTGNFADCELAWTNQPKAARLLTHRWNGMLRDSERERRWHPTQKPAALAAWVYETLGQPGDIILDPFLGSAPSLLAAAQTGRAVYGCELAVEYISIALQRYFDLTGQQPVLCT